MRPGEIVLHGQGARFHQFDAWFLRVECDSAEPCDGSNNMVELFPETLSLCHRREKSCVPPHAIWRACGGCMHKSAASPETKPRLLAHTEVARAIEQSLIETLVSCLTGASMRTSAIKRRHAGIMIMFEQVLAEHLTKPLRTTELCELIGVTEQTLRSCCTQFLGMSPIRYVLSRRLSRVRVVLRDTDPDGANLIELVRGFGFTELGQIRGGLPGGLQ